MSAPSIAAAALPVALAAAPEGAMLALPPVLWGVVVLVTLYVAAIRHVIPLFHAAKSDPLAAVESAMPEVRPAPLLVAAVAASPRGETSVSPRPKLGSIAPTPRRAASTSSSCASPSAARAAPTLSMPVAPSPRHLTPLRVAVEAPIVSAAPSPSPAAAAAAAAAAEPRPPRPRFEDDALPPADAEEERLLRLLGWSEDSASDVEPISEREVREFRSRLEKAPRRLRRELLRRIEASAC
jgi:hypothetical protein